MAYGGAPEACIKLKRTRNATLSAKARRHSPHVCARGTRLIIAIAL
jgi:hypothetical protein